MALIGNETLQVQPVLSNGFPSGQTEQCTTQQIANLGNISAGYWVQSASTLFPATVTNRVLIGGATDDAGSALQVSAGAGSSTIATLCNAFFGAAYFSDGTNSIEFCNGGSAMYVTGSLNLQQQTTPVSNPNSGSDYLYFKSDDNLYAKTSAGVEYQVNGGGGSNFTWNNVTSTSQTLAANSGYVMNNASLVTGTLPATAAFGSIIRVAGKGAGGWKIAQNAGQTIHFEGNNTTTGTGGSLASKTTYDAVELLCITANTDFSVISSIGNITGV